MFYKSFSNLRIECAYELFASANLAQEPSNLTWFVALENIRKSSESETPKSI